VYNGFAMTDTKVLQAILNGQVSIREDIKCNEEVGATIPLA